MAKFITSCSECLGKDVCTRHLNNLSAQTSKLVTSVEPSTERVSVRLYCPEYVSEYEGSSSSGYYSSSSSRNKRAPEWFSDNIPCECCHFNKLCKEDKDKQEAFCKAVCAEFDGVVQFSCASFYTPREDKE